LRCSTAEKAALFADGRGTNYVVMARQAACVCRHESERLFAYTLYKKKVPSQGRGVRGCSSATATRTLFGALRTYASGAAGRWLQNWAKYMRQRAVPACVRLAKGEPTRRENALVLTRQVVSADARCNVATSVPARLRARVYTHGNGGEVVKAGGSGGSGRWVWRAVAGCFNLSSQT